MLYFLAIIAYLLWLTLYLTVGDNLLRQLIATIFKVELKRERTLTTVDPNISSFILLFRWKGESLLIGLIRLISWLLAILLPIIFGVMLFLRSQNK